VRPVKQDSAGREEDEQGSVTRGSQLEQEQGESFVEGGMVRQRAPGAGAWPAKALESALQATALPSERTRAAGGALHQDQVRPPRFGGVAAVQRRAVRINDLREPPLLHRFGHVVL
jgi:hypothetical protein